VATKIERTEGIVGEFGRILLMLIMEVNLKWKEDAQFWLLYHIQERATLNHG